MRETLRQTPRGARSSRGQTGMRHHIGNAEFGNGGRTIGRKQTLGEGRSRRAAAWDDDGGCDHGDENGGVPDTRNIA